MVNQCDRRAQFADREILSDYARSDDARRIRVEIAELIVARPGSSTDNGQWKEHRQADGEDGRRVATTRSATRAQNPVTGR